MISVLLYIILVKSCRCEGIVIVLNQNGKFYLNA